MRAVKQTDLRTLKRTLMALVALASPSTLYAQGCPLCYQAAAASGGKFIHALKEGILIMLFPPLLILSAIFYAAYRKRNQFNGGDRIAPAKNELDETIRIHLEISE
jgi:hypothetical protein